LIIKACIFDLDGVITDTAHYHFLSWSSIAAELGYELTEYKNEELKGVNRPASLEKILLWADVNCSETEKEDLLKRKNDQYKRSIEQLTVNDILPGVLDFLADLRHNNVRIAIGSSSKNAVAILEKLGLAETFEVVSDGNSVTKTKPAPDVFLYASTALEIQPENCVVIEDAQSGIDAAIAAGMKVVGIGDHADLTKANICLPTLEGLTFAKLEKLL